MDSPSYSSPNIKRYDVFPSFHGPDVRQKFLSHLRYQFTSKGITVFDDDQGIERSQTIAPTLTRAIKESRVSIVVLSKNYASSSFCLGELIEILKEDVKKKTKVMTIFYEVDPSHVRKQTGLFGEAFEKTCIGKTEDEKQRWRHALTTVANIAGEHSLNWKNENSMIDKIAVDVSNSLNATPLKDFDGMVGVEAHVRKVNSLLRLECNEVRMVGIWGPAGIGKTTIARALYNRLSHDFHLKCFMGNMKGSYRSIIGFDDYDSKLCLQSQLLSKIFRQKKIKIDHLGVVEERLHDQRVLIILDDVDDLEKLEALAKEPSWFGPGSRIIVTTEDKKLLKAHGIDNTYLVDFPSLVETLEIFCQYAFGQNYPPDGFTNLAYKVARLCGNLPLGLRVVGSDLRRESKEEWELALPRLQTSLHGKFEEVLRVVYEKLHRKDKSLFLHIACFFNHEQLDHVTIMLSKSTNLEVRLGVEILVNKSLLSVSTRGDIMMHCLLEKFGRQVVEEQSNEPGRRQFLVDAQEICHVLANNTGTGSVIGISFDIAMIGELFISERSFEAMHNLLFLRVYQGRFDVSDTILHIPTNMNFPPCLRLLRWPSYPNKCLPSRFQPEYLVELTMSRSNLQKLWEGTKPLSNLKLMDLSYSKNLKEIPNLSTATNLEKLHLAFCTSLVELPYSIANLHKLKVLEMQSCKMLQIVPTNINLASLETIIMGGCPRLRIFPNISRNIKTLFLRGSAIKEVPPSIQHWSRLRFLHLSQSENIKTFRYVPERLWCLDLTHSCIKKFPECIKGIYGLKFLDITGCRKLVSLPKLPGILRRLYADDCESLERISSCSLNNPDAELHFNNCLKLEEETRRLIIQEWVYQYAYLPGREVPAAYFRHKAKGSSLTIRSVHSASSGFKACIVFFPTGPERLSELSCTVTGKGGCAIGKHRLRPTSSSGILTEHLFIFYGVLPDVDKSSGELLFEFTCRKSNHRIIEIGVQILTDGDKDGSESTRTDEAYVPEFTKVVSGDDEDGNNYRKLTGRWNCFAWRRRNTTQKKQRSE